MNDNLNKKTFSFSWMSVILCAMILLGIFFRLYDPGRKIYWHDETVNTYRSFGYTKQEIDQKVFTGKIIKASVLEKYLHIDPEKGLDDTVKSLVQEEAHNPPLNYVMMHMWARVFGDSLASLRTFTALVGLLAFPFIYWLCLELFGSRKIAWIAVALMAVSPFHLLFAQEARNYSLFTVTVLLASAALLRAIRVKTKLGWVVYALTLIMGLYTHTLFVLVAIGHGIYTLTMEKFRFSKTSIAYLFTSGIVLLVYTPWIGAIILNFEHAQGSMYWVNKIAPVYLLAKMWGYHSIRVFFDPIWEKAIIGLDISKLFTTPFTYALNTLVLILIVYSLYFVFRKTEKRIWLFIATLIGGTAFFLIIPDLVFGGWRSLIARYFIPCYLGIQLSVSYFLGSNIDNKAVSARLRRVCVILLATMLLIGALSCAMISKAEIWWTKYLDVEVPLISHIINESEEPLLISDTNIAHLLTLVNYIDGDVNVQLLKKPYITKLPRGYSDIFLFRPSPELISNVKNNPDFRLKEIGWDGSFWEIRKAKDYAGNQ